MERREFLLSTGGIVGATAIGSVAYTEATVTRDVTVDVVGDTSAIIGLNAGSHQAIQLVDGELTIDTSQGAAGLNQNGTFKYGSSGAPVSTYAFSVTNNDATAHALTVSLNNIGVTTFDITFYDSGGNLIDTASSGGSITYDPWAAGETIFATITIETGDGTGTNSGTLTLTAN